MLSESQSIFNENNGLDDSGAENGGLNSSTSKMRVLPRGHPSLILHDWVCKNFSWIIY